MRAALERRHRQVGARCRLASVRVGPRLYLQNTHVYVSPQFSLGSLADQTVTRLCPVGSQAIGGGVDFDTADADVQVISSAPLVAGSNLFTADQGRNPASRGWRVTMHNNRALAVTGALA